MTKILLIRHGHVEGITPERFRGRGDLPLTSRGHEQAQAVAQRIASGWRPDAVYTSPLSRCTATANAIAKACSLEAQTLDDLVDIDYGAWQSCSFAERKPDRSGAFFTLAFDPAARAISWWIWLLVLRMRYASFCRAILSRRLFSSRTTA